MKRESKVEIRCTYEEKERWRKVAAPYTLSEYIRMLLNEQTIRESIKIRTGTSD